MVQAEDRWEETPFSGADRLALVERLVSIYDEAANSRVPRWISLEAPSGWGKTRVIHELYRRLAADRQDAGLYWPESILDAVPTGPERRSLGLVANRRKRIFPEQVTPSEGALPAWMWLGIGCSRRAGSPSQALADDLTQFEQHQAGIERRWRRDADMLQKLRRAGSVGKGTEAVEASVGEALNAVVSGIAHASVPGLGFVLLAAKWSARSLRRRAERSQPIPPTIDAAGTGRADLVDELAPALTNLAQQVVPLVILVEDFHLADEGLVEVLRRIMVANASRVVLVTTAWPGLLDETDRPASALFAAVEPSRLIRLRAQRTDSSALGPLDMGARKTIARAHLPSAPSDLIDAIADRYPNPLSIELVANLGRVRQALRSGGDATTVVGALPTSVRRLFEEMWAELPEDLRRALMLGALTSPMAISDSAVTNDVHWDESLLREAVQAVDWLGEEVGQLDDDIDQAGTSYAWVRVVHDWLRCFHEQAQHDTALLQGRERYGGGNELRAMYEAMVAHSDLDSLTDPVRRLQRARVLIALELEGFGVRNRKWREALYELCLWLAFQPDTNSACQLVDLGRKAVESRDPSSPEELWPVWHNYAAALGRLGRVTEALAQSEALLDEQTYMLGPDAPGTLANRSNLALWLGGAGRVEDAIVQVEALLTDQSRVLGPTAPSTLTSRSNLAALLARAGRLDEAIARDEALLEDELRVLGPDAPATLATRNNLARWLADIGRVNEALVRFEALLEDELRLLGPEAPDTLTTRRNIGDCLGASGRVEEAIAKFEVLVADRIRVLGADAPDTLNARADLARWLGDAGQVEEATAQLEMLLADQTRILGPDAPDTFDTRGNLAWLSGEAGFVEEAIEQTERLLADRTRVLGPEAPATLCSQNDLARWLGEAGRVEEAITGFDVLLALRTHVLGRDAPETLTTRGNLLAMLCLAGREEETIEPFESLVEDEARCLGPDAPDVLNTRWNLARALANVGRVNEAIAELEALLADRIRVLGPGSLDVLSTRESLIATLWTADRSNDAMLQFEALLRARIELLGPNTIETLSTRADLVGLLDEAGRVEEEVIELEALLRDQMRLLGPDAPETLSTRNEHAVKVGETGRADEAIMLLEALLADRTRVLGANASETLVTRGNVASMLGQSGREEEAVALLEGLLADQTRVLGPDSPTTFTCRNNLAVGIGCLGRVEDAVAQLEALLLDEIRALGSDASTTLNTRASLTWIMERATRIEDDSAPSQESLGDEDRTSDQGPSATASRGRAGRRGWWANRRRG